LRIDCRHGYFRITESKSGELGHFTTIFGLDLVPKGDHFTFEKLEATPPLSVKDRPFLNLTAKATFCGHPWQIFERNGFVFDFTQDKLVEIGSVQVKVEIQRSNYYYLSEGLILPGSIVGDGKRVKDYSAWLLWDSFRFRYSELRIE
jgi:hypothetical protein